MKPREPLGDVRYALVRVEGSDKKNYINFIRGNKVLRTLQDAEGEAKRIGLLGDDCYIVEVVAGYGRRLTTTALPIKKEASK